MTGCEQADVPLWCIPPALRAASARWRVAAVSRCSSWWWTAQSCCPVQRIKTVSIGYRSRPLQAFSTARRMLMKTWLFLIKCEDKRHRNGISNFAQAKLLIQSVFITELYTNAPVSLSLRGNDCKFSRDPKPTTYSRSINNISAYALHIVNHFP